MSLVVCDASVIFKLVVAEDDSAIAFALASDYQIAVPEFLFLEIGNALWSSVRMGQSRPVDVPRLLDELDAYGFDVRPVRPLVKRSLAIAMTIDHPIYDCAYLALAESSGVPLVTSDRRFLNALRRSNLATTEVKPLNIFA